MSKEQFLKENQKEGEIYAGLVLGKGGTPDYHLFLLSEKAEDLTWHEAIGWAAGIRAVLPTHREQAILYGNLKNEFEPRRYWSSAQHASNDAFAWMQDFDNGSQVCYRKSHKYRARAVRRVYLEY